uniref:RxLR effector candidate protein n=1 Tax=Hyaloperonospora arabidopsidis (strain Emoy2) TaxID=559515 RepID=M4B1H3_HYAAE
MKKFLLYAVCLQLADTFADSTEPDTLRPVVRLGRFEHVVSPSRPEEQEVDYEVMARDYVKMARWDYRSGNRIPSQASSVH